MQLLQANKILLASCVVVIPASIYAGFKVKERYEANSLDAVEARALPDQTAIRARVFELQKERNALLLQSEDLDKKIAEVKQRIARRQQGSV